MISLSPAVVGWRQGGGEEGEAGGTDEMGDRMRLLL